jgi:hypothetical protein
MRKIRMVLAAGVMSATLLAAGPAHAGGTATVNVVHGIPGVAVNVCVDGTSVRDDFRFGRKIVGAELPAGSHRVKLVPSGMGPDPRPRRVPCARSGRPRTIDAEPQGRLGRFGAATLARGDAAFRRARPR